MSVTRFFNGYYLDYGGAVVRGEVHIEGGRIVYAGVARTNAAPKYSRQIDMKDGYLIPGFKNCHTHSAMTALRGLGEDLPLLKWLNDCVFPLEAKLTPEDVYWGTKLAILEYVRGGTTAISDMYFFEDEIARAVTESGFKCVAVGSAMDISKDAEGQLAEIEALFLKYGRADANFSFRLGHHAEYTASDTLLKGMAYLVNKYKAPIYHHLSESRGEVEGCAARTGLTPPLRLAELGLYNYGGAGYHCINLTDADVVVMKKFGVAVVSCPMSNLKVAGIAPIWRYRNAGLEIAVGTDGAASANTLDMFQETRLLSALQKGVLSQSEVMGAELSLLAAVSTGARVLGLHDCDGIQAGKTADLALIDVNSPQMQPASNPLCDIVYSARPENVRLTMVNGKILYEDGDYKINEAPERIYAEVKKIVKRIRA
ncbi:MAG: amidohydrolase [Clostridiales bacterium]|jgi:5-methylthioadenosine/S-adenosylhomocysteine deaminase|nr:amidohydrolase [Clostridiales bacterium]